MTRQTRSAAVALLLSGTLPVAAGAQATPRPDHRPALALEYQSTRSNAGPGECGCFFLQGGSTQLDLPLVKQLSLAVDVAGGRAGKAYRGYDLALFTFAAGPQLRVRLGRTVPFAQALFGAAHGSGLPFGNTGSTSANSFALIAGGGLDFPLSRRIAVRAFSADYERTQLPNGAGNQQNNLRLGAGLSISFSKR